MAKKPATKKPVVTTKDLDPKQNPKGGAASQPRPVRAL
jgi:hypothetical protein